MAWITASAMWKATVMCLLVFPMSFVNGQSLNDAFSSDLECCLERNVPRGRYCSPGLKTSWELMNPINGRYKMTFSFPQGCHPNKFKAELLVNEDVTAEQCTEETIFTSIHSINKVLKVKDWNSENCTKMCNKSGEFHFQFVFPGCYRVWVTPEYKENVARTGKVLQSSPKFLKSEYQKQLLVDKSPQATMLSDPQVPAIIHINMAGRTWKEMWLIESKLTFTLRNISQPTLNSWDVHLWTNKTATCEKNPNTKQLPKCEIDSGKMLTMRLYDVQPGEYSYILKVDVSVDNRCTSSTLWTENGFCVWEYSNITIEEPRIKIESEEELEFPNWAIGGIILVMILTAAIAGYVASRLLKYRNLPTVSVDSHKGGEVASPRPAILLLYSRDCKAFMDLMVSFRQLLKEITEFEIYDCYDPNRWSELSLNPSGWMQRLTTYRDIRVIVVASRCASLRQQAQLAGEVLHYARPQHSDELFSYGLQMLTDRTAPNAYQNTFVVRFDGFSDDNDLLIALNSYTRFVLPLHLGKLFCSLKQWIAAETNESFLNSREVKILSNDLDKLVKYKQEHANYLDSLLVKQKVVQDFGIPMAVYV